MISLRLPVFAVVLKSNKGRNEPICIDRTSLPFHLICKNFKLNCNIYFIQNKYCISQVRSEYLSILLRDVHHRCHQHQGVLYQIFFKILLYLNWNRQAQTNSPKGKPNQIPTAP